MASVGPHLVKFVRTPFSQTIFKHMRDPHSVGNQTIVNDLKWEKMWKKGGGLRISNPDASLLIGQAVQLRQTKNEKII